MNEKQKLIIELAARFFEAEVAKDGLPRDGSRANWAVCHARQIVNEAMQ